MTFNGKVKIIEEKYWIYFASNQKESIFASLFTRVCIKSETIRAKYRAFSSAGSEHLPYKQRVGGSNPSTPTFIKKDLHNDVGLFFLLYCSLCRKG